ncbi:endonuclease domain-containing protein [Streptomyces xantholiticus]|uniref:endonuclease domain-containing protein n=1 Tax=Streptomyces xantholiticus TaxID=68285 RepID=UPI0016795394|nr:endonuclease domain-containing protein [Streptomyces xantholiticus]GGW70164.1 hypothetical protein GCM10010381_63740 [Streptomyces xantholiticus]
MGRKRVVDEFGPEAWCEACDDLIDFEEPGRAKGHCAECGPAYRQARRHGITIQKVNAILRVQDDSCAICGEYPGDGGMEGISYWQIDHDQACCNRSGFCGGCVRGLLCKTCNIRGVAWYERLPDDRRDWPRMNAYLADPPAQRPEAKVSTWGDLSGVRARAGSFCSWRSSRPL